MANIFVTGGTGMLRNLRNVKKNVFIPKLSEIEKAWLACAIDTDGCVGLYHQKYKGNWEGWRKTIEVENSHLPFLEKIAILVKEPVKEFAPHPHHKGLKKMYRIRIHQTLKVYAILKQLLPYMIIKRQVAQKVIDYCERRY